MPRPRSSTFYLPLAPIDAPLELKAKLSVLPPSAANALLAPRNNSHPGQASCGFSRSATATTTNGCPISHLASTPPPTQEDECARLNRVLGIPTTHPHIVLPPPNQLAIQSNSTTSSLNLPTPARRRHTDAPRPSFPPSHRSPSRSPLLPSIPAPTPLHAPSTGSIDCAEHSPNPAVTSVAVSQHPPDDPSPATSPEFQTERSLRSSRNNPSVSIPDDERRPPLATLSCAAAVAVPDQMKEERDRNHGAMNDSHGDGDETEVRVTFLFSSQGQRVCPLSSGILLFFFTPPFIFRLPFQFGTEARNRR